MSFNIDAIRKLTMKPNALKSQSFMHIFEVVKKLIENRASQGHFEIKYTIPCFVIGYPPYDVVDCASFLYYKFREQMFDVVIEPIRSLQNVSIRVSWRSPPKNHPSLQSSQPHSQSSCRDASNKSKGTYNYVSAKVPAEKEAAPESKGKKRTYKVKDTPTTQPATMNFLHNTGIVDEIPVNPKSSIYL